MRRYWVTFLAWNQEVRDFQPIRREAYAAPDEASAEDWAQMRCDDLADELDVPVGYEVEG